MPGAIRKKPFGIKTVVVQAAKLSETIAISTMLSVGQRPTCDAPPWNRASAAMATSTAITCLSASGRAGDGTSGSFLSSGISNMVGMTKRSGTIQNVIRQEEISTNNPASPGPIKPGTTQAAASMPSAFARRASGYIRPITTYMVTKSSPIAKP